IIVGPLGRREAPRWGGGFAVPPGICSLIWGEIAFATLRSALRPRIYRVCYAVVSLASLASFARDAPRDEPATLRRAAVRSVPLAKNLIPPALTARRCSPTP